MFRFSIRELMLVTLVAVLALGWWVDRSRLATDKMIWQQRAEVGKEIVEAWYGEPISWGGPWPLEPAPKRQ